ncbi:hypothetical protein CGJ57_23940 [Vibrio parahaemolyticus]|uniref:hypothetical protein n=1 Tax=Vibrio parahaemolyticus TaxID=670 RepID=UPI0011236D35|nr:hypothetical protein [Vibrio parahaemolyticus]TOD73803.1 hypothetical protein CGJ57_23940 [Vibrio parahaemolyticus]
MLLDFKSDKRLNLYDDRVPDVFFNDLSDMDVFARKLEQKITLGEVSSDISSQNPDTQIACMVNEFEGWFDSIILFKLDDAGAISSLVVATKNRIEVNTDKFVYSVGYYVHPSKRNQGLCQATLKDSIPEISKFLSENGPNFQFGPDSNFKYVLESIVSTTNSPSNKVAATYLHDGGEVSLVKEGRTGDDSNVYTMELENQFVC